MNVAESAARHSVRDPEHPALMFEGRTINYGALDRKVARLAGALKAHGIRQGDRVALILPNCPEFVIAYLAALRLGAVAVTLGSNQDTRALGHMLTETEPMAVFVNATTTDLVPWEILHPTPLKILADGPVQAGLSLDSLVARAAPLDDIVSLPPEAPAAILFTSGTTGFPKGVVLSHGNVTFVAEAKCRYCGFSRTDRVLLIVPMFHVFGQNAILNPALHSGATIILHRKFEPDAVISSIQDESVTMFFAVPSIYSLLIERCTPENLRSVRFWFSAAAVLPEEIARRFLEQIGQPIYEGYGLTETAPFVCFNHLSEHRLGSVGTPIEDVDIRIVDPESLRAVADGQPGEVWIRGPNIMLGYWNRPDETAEVIHDGWFRSGDLGRVDPGGYLVLIDRIKDMIAVAGLKVWPAEVEAVLCEHPAVRIAAVYRRPDPTTGEKVAAQVILTEAADASSKELVQWCRGQLAAYKVPVELNIVTDLPLSPSGKVLRRVLSEQQD